MNWHIIIRINIEKFRQSMMRYRTYNGVKGKPITLAEACSKIGINPWTYHNICKNECCYLITAIILSDILWDHIFKPSWLYEIKQYKKNRVTK